MGFKVELWTIKEKTILDLFTKHFSSYQNFLKKCEEEFPEEEEFLYVTLESIKTPLEVFHLDSKVVDEIISGFIGLYCSSGEGKSELNDMGSFWSVERYKKALLSFDTGTDDVIILWKYLIYGRSILNPNSFFEPLYDVDFKVGWWTELERKRVQEELNKIVTRPSFDPQVNIAISSTYETLKRLTDYQNDLVLTVA